MKKVFIILSILFAFFSCATGTALVTGKQRPETKPEDVIIYSEAPQNYEVIGIVSASSDAGLTPQESLNYALTELKKQAAKIGANGIIVENMSTLNSGGVFLGYMYFAGTAQNISGKAIYKNDNEN